MAGDKKSAMNDPTSPYYTTAADNPGVAITPVVLKGENYDEWAKAMKNSLRAKKKLGFIDGTISKPAKDSPDLEDWYAVNSLLIAWIFNTVDPPLRSTISYFETAKEVWEDLRERFSIGNDMRIHQLKNDLVNCKQEGMTIAGYYGKLKTMWEELAAYTKNPQCTCGGCTCGAAAELMQEREKEKTHQFLMGLDNEYGVTRSNLLSMEPLPPLNRVYAVIVQEERHRSVAKARNQRTEVMSFAVQASAPVRGRGEVKDRELTCSHCNRIGHDSNNCFQLIGYPDWWGNRPKTEGRAGGNRGRGAGQQQALGRGGRGRGGNPRANATVAPGAATQSVVEEADKAGLSGLSGEQWQTLLNLLNSHKGASTERLTGPHFEDADWCG